MERIKEYFGNDHYARLAGIELLAVSEGRASARMALGPQHLNSLKTVHGGAIFTLADFAFAAAANSHGTVAVALNANITFMKASRAGELLAEAREVSRNHRIGTYVVEVKDAAGDLVAQFQGLAYRKKEALAI
ncbi:MAG TPA: hotdog fold thioesterase [Verrucomicrobia bacterium]|nr:hotdog fold thioesterase [Verrucomicrobiota bacterium]HOP97220.1 hotdog fold thioesterase [Verrucomicrobiota bacterium]HPU57804.1 hotdog fold thioesterase [Verrucomicrobiota bacterium]